MDRGLILRWAFGGVVLLLTWSCGVEQPAAYELSQVEEASKATLFSGCIDSKLFAPEECGYTCDSGRSSGYRYDRAYCQSKHQYGDLACFCDGKGDQRVNN